MVMHGNSNKPVESLFQRSHFSPLAIMHEGRFHFSIADNTQVNTDATKLGRIIQCSLILATRSAV